MKAYSALIPLILATTAAMGDALSGSSSTDGHAQAAALLSRPQIVGSVHADRSVSPSTAAASTDAQALAAALLSRPRTETPVQATVPVKVASRSADGQAQAAALLSRPRSI